MVALDPVAMRAQQLQVLDVVLAAAAGDDVVHLQDAGRVFTVALIVTPALLTEQSVLVPPVGHERSPWTVTMRSRLAKGLSMDRLRYGHRRVSRAAGDGSRNLDTQEQTLEGVGIRPELIYRDVASGGRSERAGGYRSPLRHHHGQPPGPHARNLVEGLQMIERLTEQGFGIVALDAGIDTSAANPAARLQIAMMLAFAEWEHQPVRERSIAGQLRAREPGNTIVRPEALAESAKAKIRLRLRQGSSVTRSSEDCRVARSTIYKAISDGEAA